jgi:glycosyltransferase involved in cell wall biosynthesis
MADLPPPASLGLPADSVDYVRWSPEVEVAAIASATVGLMPLRDSDWARGKCAYKMLLYLACGVPAVVSPVGMNTEVAAVARAATTLASNTDEWVEALEARLLDPSAAVRDGLTGRQAISEPYSAESVGRRLTEIVKGLT